MLEEDHDCILEAVSNLIRTAQKNNHYIENIFIKEGKEPNIQRWIVGAVLNTGSGTLGMSHWIGNTSFGSLGGITFFKELGGGEIHIP